MISVGILAALCGTAITSGLFLAVSSLVPRHLRLGDALAQLEGRQTVTAAAPAEASSWTDRIGSAAYRSLRLPLSSRTQSLLELRGRSITEHHADKVVLALVGLATPLVVGGAFAWLVGTSWSVPVGAAIALGLLGFFWPDVQLHRSGQVVREDAGEALLAFFDLVTLERLANQSAPQALASAASVSDGTPFRQIRAVLERARLEQRPPYADLRRLADELELPELRDVVDVMSLDEQGASLVESLRARVRELRDAHLTRQKIAAHETTERMTIFMVLPALVFGLIFLAPPILLLLT